jgi:hypothetical protein
MSMSALNFDPLCGHPMLMGFSIFSHQGFWIFSIFNNRFKKLIIGTSKENL